jgi:hypothetical protein
MAIMKGELQPSWNLSARLRRKSTLYPFCAVKPVQYAVPFTPAQLMLKQNSNIALLPRRSFGVTAEQVN